MITELKFETEEQRLEIKKIIKDFIQGILIGNKVEVTCNKLGWYDVYIGGTGTQDLFGILEFNVVVEFTDTYKIFYHQIKTNKDLLVMMLRIVSDFRACHGVYD